jgi:hypothetical protein
MGEAGKIIKAFVSSGYLSLTNFSDLNIFTFFDLPIYWTFVKLYQMDALSFLPGYSGQPSFTELFGD